MPDTRMMDPGRKAEPIADNPRAARMREVPLSPRFRANAVLMADEPRPVRGTGKRMPAFVKPRQPSRTAIIRPRAMRGDQEPIKAKATAKQPGGYVRLRVRMYPDGTTKVVGARKVEGPLVRETKLAGELAYEVTLGEKRLVAGSVADAAEWRSFPDPDAKRGELAGHHVTPAPYVEVPVRVPKAEITMPALNRLEIAFYRVKEEVPRERLKEGRLSAQFPRELREVARLKGLRPERLEPKVRAQLERAMK